MTEADAQHGDAGAQRGDQLEAAAGPVRGPRTWGEHDRCGRGRAQAGLVEFVVAQHLHVKRVAAQLMHEVVREGIVVVDDQQPGSHATLLARGRAAIAMALKTASALARHSASSRAGTDAATTPAPAAQ